MLLLPGLHYLTLLHLFEGIAPLLGVPSDHHQLHSPESPHAEGGDDPQVGQLQGLELLVDPGMERAAFRKIARLEVELVTYTFFLSGRSMYLFTMSSMLAIIWVKASLSMTRHFTPSASSATMLAVLTSSPFKAFSPKKSPL